MSGAVEDHVGPVSDLIEPVNNEGHQIVFVDPRKIVNTFFSRPILPKDKEVVKQGFYQNGYIDSYLISCRYAKAPEIEAFFRRAPHCYSSEKAAEVTRATMRQGNSGGYMFCYDGHIRKFVSIDLIEENFLSINFKLKSSLHRSTSPQDEIAFSLSRNSVHSFCVPLSFLLTLLRCHDYDIEANAPRRAMKQKVLSATEVGKRMVLSISKIVSNEKAVSKIAETRRQVLGITRKLPISVIEFLRSFVSNDDEGLQVCFTLANLRAIPKSVTEEQSLYLIKRFIRYYETCLPTPKPIHGKDVAHQLVHVRRAERELEKFKKLCEYDVIPEEMETLSQRMLCTQLLDVEMAENAQNDHLFEPLETACRNLVPNGTNHLEIAFRKLPRDEGNELQDKDALASVPETRSDITDDKAICTTSLSSQKDSGSTDEETNVDSPSSLDNQDECSLPTEDVTVVKVVGSKKRRNVDSCDALAESQETVTIESLDELKSKWLPVGWNLVNSTHEEFARQSESWNYVQGKADLVITQLPRNENNETWLQELVRHCGLAMKLTGVCHIFCTFLQFGKLYSAVGGEGMEMMKYPMIYMEEPATVKRKTLSQHPQECGIIAAVFWRSPDRKQKHHYSAEKGYTYSTLPPWANCVTNVLPGAQLPSSQGALKNLSVHKDLCSHILEQWCTPAGLCYNPLAGSMRTGSACFDLGVQYVALEENPEVFEAAARWLTIWMRQESNKRLRFDNSGEKEHENHALDCNPCAIGTQLCKFPGLKPTYKCRVCKKMMHDLCDWAKIVKKMPLETREMVAVCSESCHDKETQT